MVFVWRHPVILSGMLLALSGFLAYKIVTQVFASYWTCHHLLVVKQGFPDVLCSGIDIDTILFGRFHVGALNIIDKPLEIVRKMIVWTVVVFFALVSLFLTLLINNFKTVVRILVLDKEEWRRFMTSFQTWLLIFVSFCSIFFYFYLHSILPELK